MKFSIKEISTIQKSWNWWHVSVLYKYVNRTSSAQWVESRTKKNFWKTWLFNDLHNISQFIELLLMVLPFKSYFLAKKLLNERLLVSLAATNLLVYLWTLFLGPSHINYPALSRFIFPLSAKANFKFHSECFHWYLLFLFLSIKYDPYTHL